MSAIRQKDINQAHIFPGKINQTLT